MSAAPSYASTPAAWCGLVPGTSDASLTAPTNVTILGSAGSSGTKIDQIDVVPAGAWLMPPAAPSLATATTGGTVAAGTYQVETTYTNSAGETTASSSSSITTTGSTSTITITSPASVTGATGWYAYVTQAGGITYTRQQAAGSPTALATNLTLTAPPSSTGASPLTSGTTSPLVAAVVNIFLYDGTAYHLHEQVSIAANATAASSKQSFHYDSLVLPSGWSLRCTVTLPGDESLISVNAYGGSL